LAGGRPPSRPAAAHQLLPEALADVRRLSLLLAFLNMRRTLLIGASLVVTLAIAAPLVLIWSVLYTNAGLQFAIRHIPHRFSGVQLDIIGARGTVAEGLSVERVEIDHDLVHLTFQRIEGRVALMPLMLQTIRVLHGSVGSALIAVKPRSRPPGPGGPPGRCTGACAAISTPSTSSRTSRVPVARTSPDRRSLSPTAGTGWPTRWCRISICAPSDFPACSATSPATWPARAMGRASA